MGEVMKRIAAILPAMLVCFSLVPRISAAIPTPTSLTLRSGYAALANLSGDSQPATLPFSSTWDLQKPRAVWARVGHIQESGDIPPMTSTTTCSTSTWLSASGIDEFAPEIAARKLDHYFASTYALQVARGPVNH